MHDRTEQTQLESGDRLEIELTCPEMSFWNLIWSDYEVTLLEREEPRWRSCVLYVPRLFLNPSLQLAFLVRLAQKGPRLLLPPIRWLQLICFSSEIHGFKGNHALEIGPGIAFPHPVNILVGRGTRIGAGVTLYHNTTYGANRHVPRSVGVASGPRIGDRAVIYSYASIQGPLDVGQEAVVGIHVVLDGHVPPRALRTQRKLRLAGEWPGEQRTHWYPSHRGK